MESSLDFSVIGAYPRGRNWDLLCGLPGEPPRADRNIAAVPLLTTIRSPAQVARSSKSGKRNPAHEHRRNLPREGWKDGRMEGWKDGRMEGWKKTYLRLFCSERCGGMLLLNHFSHTVTPCPLCEFSLLPAKWSKFNSTTLFNSSVVYPD